MLPYLAAACAFLIVGLAAGDAEAFCRSTTCRGDKCTKDAKDCPTTGTPLFWPTSCISFSLQKNFTTVLDHDQARGAITRAFQHWSDVECAAGGRATITFTPTDDVACKRSEYDSTGPNLNVVMFQDLDWQYRGLDATLAKTNVTFNPKTGEIYDADIEINTAINPYTVTDPPAVVKYDVEAVLTHEVGHFLGIAHSTATSVMLAEYNKGSTFQRQLQADDIAALCAIYPPGRDAACNAEPKGGPKSTCDEPPSTSSCATSGESPGRWTALWPAGAAFGALIVARKRARRATLEETA